MPRKSLGAQQPSTTSPSGRIGSHRTPRVALPRGLGLQVYPDLLDPVPERTRGLNQRRGTLKTASGSLSHPAWSQFRVSLGVATSRALRHRRD